MTHGFAVGDWCWHERLAAPCRIVEKEEIWGKTAYRVWLRTRDTVVQARARELTPIHEIQASLEHILYSASAARLQDALEGDLLLAPIQSKVVPLPHQLQALHRATSRDRIRYLLADEVGLGKTIEAGLVLRELKLRGLVRRCLVVAPKGLVRQWQIEMRLHFSESFHFIKPSSLAAFRQWRNDEETLWHMHDQVICSLDSVKPVDGRRGWSQAQLNSYNQERFQDLVSAAWDLVIIDEAHRLGGSSEQVARYRLGAALAEATPYLLLLSATPHQGKTDQFHRLMQLLDQEAFPDENSITSERVHPYVIRTEKRAAIDLEGNPLFKPRNSKLYPVSWKAGRHDSQQQLYEAVTSYVRHGYNQALAAQQRYIGFLMILMQRLVTSSTAAIRTTLEKRQSLLDQPDSQATLFEEIDMDEWSELDGQAQADLAVQAKGWERERSEVDRLLELARAAEATGTDAKAETLLELIYQLQQEENDPYLKVLVFTEFVPTQSMLAEFLESRGFTVAQLNGSMNLEARTAAQNAFADTARVLISTDAGGEGLNLQFCHVVVNFDMPWNPMRVEQRIGRVDRIGQPHVVRAINFVLEDTVEHRVREVLETKLDIIAQEFGVDKAADVMDSVEVDPLFDALFVQSLQAPQSIEQECEDIADQLRSTIADDSEGKELISQTTELDAEQARKWRDHPAQFWLERAITYGLPAKGGNAIRQDRAWRLRWLDGSKTENACFDARTAEYCPDSIWVTLEDPRARAVVSHLQYHVPEQPIPTISIEGLPETVQGVWSLWQINLSAEDFRRKHFLPIFLNSEGRGFTPTANRVWELLLTEQVKLAKQDGIADGQNWFELSRKTAMQQGEQVFQELVQEHHSRIQEERERAEHAYQARRQSIGRIGLDTVRAHRHKRLQADHDARMGQLERAEAYSPSLNAVLMLRIGKEAS